MERKIDEITSIVSVTSFIEIRLSILEMKNGSQCIFGLAVTLTFELLTSKSNQFIFVPNGT